MKTFATALLITLLGLPFFVGMMIALGAFEAWVLSKLWLWYIVPVFNIPVPSLPLLFGLSLVAHVLTHQTTPTSLPKDTSKEERIVFNLGGFLRPLFALIIGYFCKSWFL